MEQVMIKSEPIKLIIADDHSVFRSGLEGIIRKIEFVSKIAHAANGEEVLKLLKHEHYHVVLMDIKMKPLDGFETTATIKQSFPKTKVIALSMFDDENTIIKVLKKGASGY